MTSRETSYDEALELAQRIERVLSSSVATEPCDERARAAKALAAALAEELAALSNELRAFRSSSSTARR
jgi:hypothetical protein